MPDPRVFAAALLLPLAAAPARGDEGLELFERKIRPVLIEHCYECHSEKSARLRGGLRADLRDGLRTGGESGDPAVVPGKPGEGTLLAALRHESFEMPPKGRLPESVIADFERWIRLGAPDPRDGAAATAPREIDIAAARKQWPFLPLAAPEPPEIDDPWPRSDIDRFILAELREQGLQPAPDADRRTLLRRLHYDLTGLPPTPEQIRAFVDDDSPMAVQRVVDQLLQSRAFAQRWGRHWLDVARFAESSGGGRSLMFPEAWRYRDYVIDSIHRDKPFDLFLTEQIAGDLLESDSQQQADERIVAAGYLILGAINYELQDKELLEMEVIDEQLDAIGRGFMALTLGCARCHDHKFDPISTRDYYSMAAIFANTRSITPGNVSGYVKRPLGGPEAAARLAEHKRRTADAAKRVSQLERELAQLGERGAVVVDNHDAEQVEQQLAAAREQLAQLKKNPPPPPAEAMTVVDVDRPRDNHVRVRGQVRSLGEPVPRSFLSVVPGSERHAIPGDHSGRLELARWLTSPEHPLTARVMTNRVWHHLLGAGIVRTVDNFGAMGERPSHPELLDHLAVTFREDGWSIKRLVRRIVLSRTYQLSSEASPAQQAADPENRLLACARRRRLDAESIRDTMLSVAGRLQPHGGGRTIRKLAQYDLGYDFGEIHLRSVYVPAFRNARIDLFAVFDAANPNLVTGRRAVSTLPTQALYMMNSPFVQQQAEHTARLLLRQQDRQRRLESAFLRLLGRPPRAAEAAWAQQLAPGDELRDWRLLVQLLMASVDFRYLY